MEGEGGAGTGGREGLNWMGATKPGGSMKLRFSSTGGSMNLSGFCFESFEKEVERAGHVQRLSQIRMIHKAGPVSCWSPFNKASLKGVPKKPHHAGTVRWGFMPTSVVSPIDTEPYLFCASTGGSHALQ